MDKKKQPKLPGPAAAEKADNAPSEEDEESYEEVPRHRAAETIKERERADLLPVKVNGELVYRRDAKTDNIDLPPVRIYHQRLQTHPKHLPIGYHMQANAEFACACFCFPTLTSCGSALASVAYSEGNTDIPCG